MNFDGICKFCNHKMDLIDNYTNKYTCCEVYIIGVHTVELY